MSRNPFFCSFTKLLRLGNLENSGQLPVLQVLEGTDDWVLRIFIFLNSLCFRCHGIHFLQVQKATHVGVTSKIAG